MGIDLKLCDCSKDFKVEGSSTNKHESESATLSWEREILNTSPSSHCERAIFS